VAGRAFHVEDNVDGVERYVAAVRRRADDFADAWGDIAPVRFAVAAWRIATALSPPYVRWHRRVLSAAMVRSDWDGSLTCEVSLASGWPAELTWSRQWWRDQGWQSWPQLFGQFVGPSEQDITRRPHLRATLFVQAPVRLDNLPPAPDGPDEHLEQSARRAVTVLVRELNELLGPMIEQLDADAPAEN
jgi:hypothetical protein